MVFNRQLVKKAQSKRPRQNGEVQIDLSKITLWLNWTWEQKKTIGVVFLLKFSVKEEEISCNVSDFISRGCEKTFQLKGHVAKFSFSHELTPMSWRKKNSLDLLTPTQPKSIF
jgi:hypothetical protein